MPEYSDPLPRNTLRDLQAQIDKLARQVKLLQGRQQVIMSRGGYGGYPVTPGAGDARGAYPVGTVIPNQKEGELRIDVYDEPWYWAQNRSHHMRTICAGVALDFLSTPAALSTTPVTLGSNLYSNTDGFLIHTSDSKEWLLFPPGWHGVFAVFLQMNQAGGAAFQPGFIDIATEIFQDNEYVNASITQSIFRLTADDGPIESGEYASGNPFTVTSNGAHYRTIRLMNTYNSAVAANECVAIRPYYTNRHPTQSASVSGGVMFVVLLSDNTGSPVSS